MLSISKLTSGHARYYVDEAGERVDAAESIGEGAEEYYTGPSTEASGSWFGAAARKLGLQGEVGGEQLRRVLDGLDGDRGLLRESSSPVKVGGYDLTFSAPKSVSVLFGLGDEHVREATRRAHDAAVVAALEHVERAAAAVRRGHGGLIVEPAAGFAAGLLRHRTSRVGDPQLHTHAVVANLGRGPDGRWSTLDGRRIYAQARTASFVYQAVLRSELSRELGVEWTPVRRGIAEVAGVPRPVLRAFSRRRAEIEAELERHNTSGPAASEAAALATRGRTDRSIGPQELQAEWRERAQELGFGQKQLASLIGRAREREEPVAWERVFDTLASPVGLTRAQSTFDRRDVIQALCERLPAGAVTDSRVLEAAADRFLASSRAVALLPDGETFRRADGRLLPLAREQQRYSTPELLAREQHIVDRATTPPASTAPQADEADVAAAISRRPTLSEEQQQMVEHVCNSPARVVVVAGKAGTGKTFALAAAREAWQQAGHPVVGVAVARRAARGLAVEMVHNQRQTEAWECSALDHVADGRAADAVAAYQQHGRIHTAPTADQTRTRLVADWWQRHAGGEDAIILAHRRTDVAELNQLARDKAQAAGRLRGPQLELPGGAFAAGDLVVVKRNDSQHGVTNGDRGQITHVDPEHQRLTVRIENRQVELGPGFLHDTTGQGGPTLQHGYALTCHVAQGLTADSAFLLADTGLSKELAYTALSRGRKANHLYLTEHPDLPQAEFAPVEPPGNPLDRLTTMLATSSAQQLGVELDPMAAVREAETRLQRASRERRDIEASRWTPRRGHRLAAAQRREAAAAEELAQTRRTLQERRHGQRPFVTERELDQQRAEQIERVTDRLKRSRERGRGREL